ncbi:hypothetical protein BDY24DRAFT_411973 [Mrakia frigida]|uniref:uncharacterized protein n=1 Tax=Mrakia frigida TaxID=29902 RepID=UPI003FCBFBB7
MVQLSRDILQALSVLQQSSQLPSSLSSRLQIALRSFQGSSLPNAPPHIPWSAFHPILVDVQAALPTVDQRNTFAELLRRAEEEMKGVEQAEKSTGGGGIEMKSNGLLPPPHGSPSSSPSPRSPPSKPSTPVSTPSSLFIPPSLLPLILSALSSDKTTNPKASLQNATLLTTLAVQPDLILPPGKTLASLLSLPDAEAREKKRKRMSGSSEGSAGRGGGPIHGGSLEERVGNMMKAAYWDDATDKLLSSPPTCSLRLSLLQTDLSTAFSGLLPPMKLKDLFPVPDQTTIWDRKAFSTSLANILEAAKARCAPVRDEEVLRLERMLEATKSEESGANEKDATKAVLSVVEGVLELAELMKSDLSTFRLLSIPPASLPSLVTSLAETFERTEILSNFPSHASLTSSLSTYLAANTPHSPSEPASLRLYASLVSTVTSSHPISQPPLPTSDSNPSSSPSSTLENNQIPPILIGTSPILFNIQNHIQAIVITASLVALAPGGLSPDASRKIYQLLMADLHAEGGEQHTHLEDLTQIVLACWSASSTPAPSEEEKKAHQEKIREGVQRVLRTTDPVWNLLLSRLKKALITSLTEEHLPMDLVPERMQSGRGEVRSSMSGGGGGGGRGKSRRIVVKGFEGEVLEQGIGNVVDGLKKVGGWVGEVWGDVLKGVEGVGASTGV